MRRLVDMDNKSEAGLIDWEFIHDMQGIAPDQITPEQIYLTRDFIKKIPEKWHAIKTKLAEHVSPDKIIHLAISDLENMGNEFKVRGIFKNKKGEVLAFHKIVLYDEDRFQDDYLGAVISNAEGEFTLAFGKKVFSDSGLETEPDIYFRVYYWENGNFHELGRIMPDVFQKTEAGNHVVIEFGVISI